MQYIDLSQTDYVKEAADLWKSDNLYFDGYNYRTVNPKSRKGTGPIYKWNKEIKHIFPGSRRGPRLLHTFATIPDKFKEWYPNYFIHRVS